ncbi:MAG: hypothetical protein ACTHMV_13520 [Chitinophagaceae bacterium]
MLRIIIAGEDLDLSPGTSVELERSSPFFNLSDLAGEYSLPLTLPYTPKNARLLGLPNHYYTRRIKKRISSKIYDNNNFAYTGELIIETANLHLNSITKSNISGYFLTGVSSFFQAVKNKKLQELALGGIRSFVWTNSNPDSPVKGFWQHVNATLEGGYDYLFAPIINEKWDGSGEGDVSWLNKIDIYGKLDYEENYNTLAPQVNLKYVLTQIFEEHGWTLETSGMSDPVWDKLFIPSFYAVTWQKIIQTEIAPFFDYAPLGDIKINLQNHVPPGMLISDFIIALRNRYNWGFDFDASKKNCRLFPIKNLAAGRKKDWTKFTSATLSSDFSEDPKVFVFKNEIDSSDALSSSPDLTKVSIGEPKISFSELPPATEDNFNLVIFCWKENQFFQCSYDEVEQIYSWILYANNIYDYSPAGGNEEITTIASTMPVYKRMYRDAGATQYYGLFPYCEQEGNWEGKKGSSVAWGLRLLVYRGRVFEASPLGFPGPVKYPYLTSTCITITQEEPDLPWSNVYIHTYEGEDKGIVSYWFKDTLPYLSESDVISTLLYLTREELLNFQWSDIILLRNVPYIAQKFVENIPYTGYVKADLRRIF